MRAKTWHVDIYLSEEDDDSTRARAVLRTGEARVIEATGTARRNPTDREVAEIGDEVAAARALAHLAERLSATAGADIASVTGEPAAIRP
jgi:hypothetical protein